MGGAQSIHTNGKDEAISLPSEKNALLALRTQQIIAHETNITDFVDPIGDSSIISDMTNNIVKEVLNKIDDINKKGGMEKLIDTGEIEEEISNASIEFQNKLDKKEEILIGVNKFVDEEKIDLNISEKDDKNRIDSLIKFRKNRDHKKVSHTLLILEEKAKLNENLIPYIIECAKSRCTLGEISDSLRKIFGEYS